MITENLAIYLNLFQRFELGLLLGILLASVLYIQSFY